MVQHTLHSIISSLFSVVYGARELFILRCYLSYRYILYLTCGRPYQLGRPYDTYWKGIVLGNTTRDAGFQTCMSYFNQTAGALSWTLHDRGGAWYCELYNFSANAITTTHPDDGLYYEWYYVLDTPVPTTTSQVVTTTSQITTSSSQPQTTSSSQASSTTAAPTGPQCDSPCTDNNYPTCRSTVFGNRCSTQLFSLMVSGGPMDGLYNTLVQSGQQLVPSFTNTTGSTSFFFLDLYRQLYSSVDGTEGITFQNSDPSQISLLFGPRSSYSISGYDSSCTIASDQSITCLAGQPNSYNVWYGCQASNSPSLNGLALVNSTYSGQCAPVKVLAVMQGNKKRQVEKMVVELPHLYRRDLNGTSNSTFVANTSTPINTTASDVPAGFDFVTIVDTTGQYFLQNINSNFFLVATSTNLTGPELLFISQSKVILANSFQQLILYYPQEMNLYNVSRLRSAYPNVLPNGSESVSLAAVDVDNDPTTPLIYVGVTTGGTVLYPITCNIQGQSSKVFLATDPVAGVQTLQSDALQNTVTGGVVTSCYFLPFQYVAPYPLSEAYGPRPTVAPSTTSDNNVQQPQSQGLSGGQIAGIVIGCVAFVAILVAVGAALIVHHRKKSSGPLTSEIEMNKK